MFKVILAMLAAATMAMLLTAVSATVLTSRTPARIPTIQIDDELMPGHILPTRSTCNWADAMRSWHPILTCEVLQRDGHAVYFIYDYASHVIKNTSMRIDMDGYQLGQMILAWGDPDGYNAYGGTLRVFWGNRSLYTVDKQGPTSPVMFIAYQSDKPDALKKWKGFIKFK